MDNETERDAAAMALFGRSAQELNPMIKAGSERMRELAQAAHDTGYVLSEEELGSLNGLSDAFDSFDKLIDTTKNKLALEFTPQMMESMGTLQTFITDLSQALQDSGIVDVLAQILEDVTGLVSPTQTLTGELPQINTSLRPVAQALALMASAVHVIGAALDIGTLIDDPSAYADELKFAYTNSMYQQLMDKYQREDFAETAQYIGEHGMPDAAQAIRDATTLPTNGATGGQSVVIVEQQQNQFSADVEKWLAENPDVPKLNGQNAIGAHNWRGGFTRVGENGPENVWLPRGSRIETAQASRGAGDTYINVTIDAKNVREFNDVIAAAERARMQLRKAAG